MDKRLSEKEIKRRNVLHVTNWKKNNPEKVKKYQRESWLRIHAKTLEIVGKGKMCCARCGCDVVSMLEINHKNGGGYRERMAVGGRTPFLRRIARGERSADDLELLCRVCNATDHVERTTGKKYLIKILN
jgi:hypothetical protein